MRRERLYARMSYGPLYKGGLDHKKTMWETKKNMEEKNQSVKFSFLGKFLSDDLV